MNQILLATVIVLGTAVLVAGYDHATSTEENAGNTKSTFAKVAVAGAIVAAGVIYFTSQKPKLNNAPFEETVPSAAPAPPAQGQPSVQMPMG
jgi:hypothetical protein